PAMAVLAPHPAQGGAAAFPARPVHSIRARLPRNGGAWLVLGHALRELSAAREAAAPLQEKLLSWHAGAIKGRPFLRTGQDRPWFLSLARCTSSTTSPVSAWPK